MNKQKILLWLTPILISCSNPKEEKRETEATEMDTVVEDERGVTENL